MKQECPRDLIILKSCFFPEGMVEHIAELIFDKWIFSQSLA